MRIERKKDAPKEAEKPVLGEVDARLESTDDAEQQEAEQKYAGPKAFDWSKVRGGGMAPKRETPRKEESKSASTEVNKAVAVIRTLDKRDIAIAATTVLLLIGIIYFAFLRGDPGLSPVLSNSELQRMGEESKKEMIDSYRALEKTFGADHPEARQQRELLRQMKIEP
jgi:hypothetical protein